ncbi:immunoglobulin-like domain-containing protein, partial [Aquibacillus rhizosphaerae]
MSRRSSTRPFAIVTIIVMLFSLLPTNLMEVSAAAEDQKILDYDMSNVDGTNVADSAGEFDGTLVNPGDAELITNSDTGTGVISFQGGDVESFIEIPNGVLDGLESVTVSTLVNWEGSGGAQWLYGLGQDNMRYLYYTPSYIGNNNHRFGMATNQYNNEVSAQASPRLAATEWKLVTTVMNGADKTLTTYIDGVEVATQTTAFTLEEINNVDGISGNIAKSFYGPDPYFGGMIADFEIYQGALTDDEIKNLQVEAQAKVDAIGGLDGFFIKFAAGQIDIEDYLRLNPSVDEITTNLELPDSGAYNTTITWSSDHPDIIAADGTVTKPSFDNGDQAVVLTATISDGTDTQTKDFTVTVLKRQEDSAAFQEDVEALVVHHIDDVRGNLHLPTEGDNGSTITWVSSDESVITTTGEVTRPANGAGDVTVDLTAELTLNSETHTKEFTAKVKEMPKAVEDNSAYLLTYFEGEFTPDGEQIRFAMSEGNDVTEWNAINNGNPVIRSHLGEEGLRDPSIIRSPEGDKFYLLATDLKVYDGDTNNNWGRTVREGSNSLMIWESTDLVNWSEQRMVEITSPETGQTWAPEVYYDDATGEYIVYWASFVYDSVADRYGNGSSHNRIMYAKTRDFHNFTEPKTLFDRGHDILDTVAIDYNDKVYRITKGTWYTEKQNSGAEISQHVFQDVGDSFFDTDFELIKEGIGMDELDHGEGAEIFKSNTEEDKFYLLIDEYGGGSGYNLFETTDLANADWKLSDDINLPDRPRHGDVLNLTQEEFERLQINIPGVGVEVTEPEPPGEEEGLVAHYDMTKADNKLTDVTNNGFDANYVGFEEGDFAEEESDTILNFTGDDSEYIELPTGLIDDETFTIETTFNTSTSANHWLYSLGTKTGEWPDVNNYIFLNPKQGDDTIRFGIKDSETELVNEDASINSGEYNTFTATFEEGSISLYLNGQAIGNIPHTYSVMDILEDGVDAESDVIGFIGRSLYTPDAAFTGKLADFKVYNYALSSEEITGVSEEDIVNLAKSELVISNEDSISESITLPSELEVQGQKVNVSWESSNPAIIANDGTVNQPSYEEGNQDVVMTATISKGDTSVTKEFIVTVVRKQGDSEAVRTAAEALKVYNINDVRGNLTLPTEGENGTSISWTSEDESIITPTGEVTRPANGEGNETVKLTATISLNDQSIKKAFAATVLEMPEHEDFKGYFFPYMTGEGSADGEQVYFALSEGNDPLNWQLLNDGETVLTSELGEEGVRDPYILRSPEGDKFYLIATDLKMHGNGDWGRAQTDGSHSIMVWESTDLVNWTDQRLVEVAPPEAGNTWAPEYFYDDTTGEYVIFWASKLYDSEEDRNSGNSYQRMMYTKTRDFHNFTEPEVYLDYGYSIIDTTMIKHNDKIYRFTKDERGNSTDSPNGKFIFQEVGDSVLDPEFDLIKEGIGKGDINQGEGATVFKSNTEEKWYLFIDEYGGRGYVPFETTDLDSGEWTLSEDYDLPNRPRHGTVMPITQTEYDALLANDAGPVEPNEEDFVTDVTLDLETVELTEGESSQLTATVIPDTAVNKAVAWVSSNEEVATVDESGNVTAVKAGTAFITVTTADGGHMATSEVTVEEATDTTPGDDRNELTLGGDSQEVEAGETYTVTGTSAKVTMPADLPVGTKMKV